MKRVLFIVYHPPVGTIWINEALRTAFGMYGEDIEPSVLFVGYATISLNAELDPQRVGPLPLKILFPYVKRFGTQVYAVQEDVEQLRISSIEDQWNATVISRDDLPEFVHDFDLTIVM